MTIVATTPAPAVHSSAAAYGVAVTGTFLITTTLFLIVARAHWRWKTWQLVLVGVVFGGIELTYFSANLTKVAHAMVGSAIVDARNLLDRNEVRRLGFEYVGIGR